MENEEQGRRLAHAVLERRRPIFTANSIVGPVEIVGQSTVVPITDLDRDFRSFVSKTLEEAGFGNGFTVDEFLADAWREKTARTKFELHLMELEEAARKAAEEVERLRLVAETARLAKKAMMDAVATQVFGLETEPKKPVDDKVPEEVGSVAAFGEAVVPQLRNEPTPVAVIAPKAVPDVLSEIVNVVKTRRANYGLSAVIATEAMEMSGAIPDFLAGCSWEVIAALRGFVSMTKNPNSKPNLRDYKVTDGTPGDAFCIEISRILGEMLKVLKKDPDSDFADREVFAQVSRLSNRGWFGWFFASLPNFTCNAEERRKCSAYLSSADWTPEVARVTRMVVLPTIGRLIAEYDEPPVPQAPRLITSIGSAESVDFFVPKQRPITLVKGVMRAILAGFEDKFVLEILIATPNFINLINFKAGEEQKFANEAIQGFMVDTLAKDITDVRAWQIATKLGLTEDAVRVLVDKYLARKRSVVAQPSQNSRFQPTPVSPKKEKGGGEKGKKSGGRRDQHGNNKKGKK